MPAQWVQKQNFYLLLEYGGQLLALFGGLNAC
jgi:hypothetical protein